MNSNNYHSIGLCILLSLIILLIAIKTRGQNTDQKLIAGNEILYVIRVLMYYMLQIIYEQHNIWWDNTIVGYNNCAHTVSRLTPSYMISIVLALEHSRFDQHVPLMKIRDLFDCKQCALLYYVILALNHILSNLDCP